MSFALPLVWKSWPSARDEATPMVGSMIVKAKGSIDVRADRDAVWAALHDPGCVAACLPGCRRVTRRAARQPGDIETYVVEAAVRLGPLCVPFDGTVAIEDCEAPALLTLTGRGRGRFAGTASGAAALRLEQRPGGCRVVVRVEARIDGPMAQLGPFLLNSLAATLSDRFARRFRRVVERGLPPPQSARWRSNTPSNPTMS